MVLHDEAWRLYEAGRYRAAIEKLERAVGIDPLAKELVYNLAVLHEKLQHTSEAARHYRRYLELESNGKARARVEAAIRRVEGAERETAEAMAAARRPPVPPASVRAPPHRHTDAWIIAPAALGGAALTVGIAFGVGALAINPGAMPETGRGVSAAELEANAHAAHTDAVVADVAFGLAVASAATVVAILLVRASHEPHATGKSALARFAVETGAFRLRF